VGRYTIPQGTRTHCKQ